MVKQFGWSASLQETAAPVLLEIIRAKEEGCWWYDGLIVLTCTLFAALAALVVLVVVRVSSFAMVMLLAMSQGGCDDLPNWPYKSLKIKWLGSYYCSP